METHDSVGKTGDGEALCDSGSSTPGSVRPQRRGMGRQAGGRPRREGACAALRLTHADVWQKPTQFCKATILPLKHFLKSF